MPFSSSSLISVAWLKRGGGWVKCCSGSELVQPQAFAFGQRRQLALGLVVLVAFLALVIAALGVHADEAVELHDLARGAEQRVRGGDVDRGLIEHRGRHLAGHEAVPNQRVERQLFFGEIRARRCSGVLPTAVGRMASCASCAPFLLG